MRIGVNPEKYKTEENHSYFHRIIIPVHIPDSADSYYQNSITVFEHCLKSLFKTYNPEITAITIIDNNSCSQVQALLKKHRRLIDKTIINRENKGKVNAVLNEAMGAYEPYITIADADVFFFGGWENAVFEVFKNNNRAGVVSPIPSQSLALYNNTSIFIESIFNNKIKYGKIVTDEDCELYLKGMGNKTLLNRNNRKYSWKEKQYYIEGKENAVIGANHFIATYKKEIFSMDYSFPRIKFKNGYEREYFDKPSDVLGLYRLSTIKNYAYHLGGAIDSFILDIKFDEKSLVNEDLLKNLKKTKYSIYPYFLRKILFKFFHNFKKW